MTRLSARAQALLASAKKEATPTAQELSHLRDRLSATLADSGPAPVFLPFSLGRLAGVLLVAAAGVGGWALRGALDPKGNPVVVVSTPSRGASGPATECPTVPSCPPPVAEVGRVLPAKPAACAPARGTAASDEQESALRRGLRHDLFTVAAAKGDPSLELELLMLARVALDEDRPLDAAGHALRHQELFARSAFEEERLAIQVLAWCAAGNQERAAPLLERLTRLAPRTSYLPRITGTCGEGFVRGDAEEAVEP